MKKKPIKRRPLGLEEKIDIINRLDKGEKQCDIAKSLFRNQSTISTISTNRNQLLYDYQCGKMSLVREKRRKSPFHELEVELYDYFSHLRNSCLIVNGNILRAKALKLNLKFKFPNFTASEGWLSRFKNRYNIGRLRLCGEAASVDHGTCEEWKEKLPKIIEGYSESEIFNCDESAFYYKMISHQTLGQKGITASGLKRNKTRVTVFFCVNMDASIKYPIVIVGKNKTTGATLENNNVNCIYKSRDSAWMSTGLFNEIMIGFNDAMKKLNKKVVMFLDNAPVHSKELNL